MRSTGSRLGQLIKLIMILLVIAVIALAVTPLKLYYPYVSDQLAPIKLKGINGSAVKGHADDLYYNSAPVGQSDWFLYPRSYDALAGTVRLFKDYYDLTFELDKIQQDQVRVGQLSGYLDWQLIKPFVQMRYGQISGYAQLDLQNIVYDKAQGIERMSGQITLKDFKMLKPTVKELGQVAVTFTTKQTGVIVGQFSSDSDVLNVSGSLFIQPHRWQLNLDIIPKAGHFELDAVLNSVGDARRGGGRKLNLAGFY